jgi:hypothetical protein
VPCLGAWEPSSWNPHQDGQSARLTPLHRRGSKR